MEEIQAFGMQTTPSMNSKIDPGFYSQPQPQQMYRPNYMGYTPGINQPRHMNFNQLNQ